MVHLVKTQEDASLNETAKHAALITGQPVSANLVKGVRKRNKLEKPTLKTEKSNRKIGTSYEHVVSIDVVEENKQKVFGLIRDQKKVTYHYLGAAHTAVEAVIALKGYIALYGKPDAVRSDNGSEFRGEFAEYLKKEGIKPLKTKPYNPKANGFIERYFRTLRKALFRRLNVRHLRLTQSILDDFAFLWNYLKPLPNQGGKTPAELAGLDLPWKMLNRFQMVQETIGKWTFWHITGVQGLLHAYLRTEMLPNLGENPGQKVA